MNKIVIALAMLLVVGGGFYFYKTRQAMPEKKGVLNQEEASTANMKNQSYAMDEVSKHNSETDCWMAIEGKVYNATSFVINHPGGQAILKGCGTDATKLFKERPTNKKGPHPDKARSQLEKLYIGELSK